MLRFPGIIGRKLGMTQVFTDDGRRIGVTAVEAGPCIVIQVKKEATEGYNSIQLGFGQAKRLNSPEKGRLKELGNLEHLKEFRVQGDAFKVGDKVDVSLFQPGDVVDVIGDSKGKGFAGGVKRYHFKGGPKTHGQSDRQRAPGSIGSNTYPGRVWPGQRMAGHLGARQATVQRLMVVKADASKNLLLLRGAAPGGDKGIVFIRKAEKRK
ncbi:MAG: 50S ribosomal protein L3 [Chloroflexi bacterium]|nr:50S ribosomal protein L3 [Chloroflexota bacterium]